MLRVCSFSPFPVEVSHGWQLMEMDTNSTAAGHSTGYSFRKVNPAIFTYSVCQDGLGGNGGVTKPDPMLTLDITGTFENLKVVNSPQRAVSVNGKSSGALTVTGVTVDNCKNQVCDLQQ